MLLACWGEAAGTEIARRLGRPLLGVAHRAKKLRLPSPRQGRTTLRALSQQTGYDKVRLRNAAERLGLRLPRLPGVAASRVRAPWHAIEKSQADAILAYLAKVPDSVGIRRKTGQRTMAGEWGTGQKPLACIACALNDRPHYCRGMDRECYDRARAALRYSREKARLRERRAA